MRLPWLFPLVTVALAIADLSVLPVAGDAAAAAAGLGVAITFAVVGAIIASRRPENGIGWVLCVFALNIPAESLLSDRLAAGYSPTPGMLWLYWVAAWVWAPMLASLVTYLPLTFPHGRVSGKWAWVTLSFAAFGVLLIVVGTAFRPGAFDDAVVNPIALPGQDQLLSMLTEVGLIPVAVAVVSSIASLVVRLRRSPPAERQQFKWFLFGLSVAVVGVVANFVLYEAGNVVAAQIAFGAAFVWLPVSIGIAILRHGLFDIDRIISRTLGWSLLTVVLATLYLACVAGLTAALSSFAGDSAISVAASTLAVAAAFRPARRRIQATVDRYFYRSRYDAARTAQSYRVGLRDTLEVDSLRADLLGVVASTLQPKSAVLWLRRSHEVPR